MKFKDIFKNEENGENVKTPTTFKVVGGAIAAITFLGLISAFSSAGKLDLTDPVADNELRHLNAVTGTNVRVLDASTVQQCDSHYDKQHKELLCYNFNFDSGIVTENYLTPGLETQEQVNKDSRAVRENVADNITNRKVEISALKGDDAAMAARLQKLAP